MVYQYSSRAGLFWPSFGIQIPLAGTINICLKSFEIYEKLHFLKMNDETTTVIINLLWWKDFHIKKKIQNIKKIYIVGKGWPWSPTPYLNLKSNVAMRHSKSLCDFAFCAHFRRGSWVQYSILVIFSSFW